MPELVTIPIAIFEFSADYERPVFKLWIDRSDVIQAIFDAWASWNPRIDDMEAINVGKVSEQGLTIKLPLKGVSFFFTPASCKFTRDNVHWQAADETLAILDAAVSALTRSGGVVLNAKNAGIAMHIQPKSLPFTTLLLPFIASPLVSLDSKQITTMAAVAKWEDHRVTIDGSAVLANAIFLRLERNFPASATYSEIVTQLRKDQEDLFRILGVEEDRG